MSCEVGFNLMVIAWHDTSLNMYARSALHHDAHPTILSLSGSWLLSCLPFHIVVRWLDQFRVAVIGFDYVALPYKGYYHITYHIAARWLNEFAFPLEALTSSHCHQKFSPVHIVAR